jgi:SP family sugar:H+ symporter-like MFS transporter
VSINSFITQIILNTINFLVTFIGLYLVEHYGRRKSLISGSLWMFVCFMIFASVGHWALDRDDSSRTPHAGIAMIVFACLFILGFATTWGPMIWTIMAEIYPSRYRAKAMALATASVSSQTNTLNDASAAYTVAQNWLWNFLLAFFTPFITGDIDFLYGFVFAGCNLIGAAIVYFFVIEGKGLSIEEIDTAYLEHVKPWESSKWVPPTPAEMAKIRRQAGTDIAGTEEPSESYPVASDGTTGAVSMNKKAEENGLDHSHHENA